MAGEGEAVTYCWTVSPPYEAKHVPVSGFHSVMYQRPPL